MVHHMANFNENSRTMNIPISASTSTPDPSLRLAFDDPTFMQRDENRGIRLQLELLKADLAQREADIHQTVVVFGSARFMSMEDAQAKLVASESSNDVAKIAKARLAIHHATYYEAARAFARLVATDGLHMPPEQRLTICTGGGPGIMEAANRGATEAGAVSVALNIALPHEQLPNPYVSPHLSFKFHYFAIRKMHFVMRAKALVAFPGGFGTMDELFEILTLVQTGKTPRVPILLYGSDYWKKVVNFDAMQAEGTVNAEDIACFQYVDTPEQAWALVKSFISGAQHA